MSLLIVMIITHDNTNTTFNWINNKHLNHNDTKTSTRKLLTAAIKLTIIR